MDKHISFSRRLVGLIGSRKFFWAVVALLVLQAAWIALSGRYPMAFDEDFHFGLIKLYAHHLSPIWSGQPPDSDTFGAVARDPSYLYQYLMSFPYRLVNLFTHNQTIQVLSLRAINIGLFAWGLTLYRRLLLQTGASRAIVHACLLAFVLVPIAPFLAAQINYDNLFLPMVALALVLVLRFDRQITHHKRLDVKTLAELLVVCLSASLVKYAFLPVFLVIIGFIMVRIWQYRQRPEPKHRLTSVWWRLSGWLGLGLLVMVVTVPVLFGERYGVNLVRYHKPVPDCAQVLNIQRCSSYGPWVRDYNFEINKVNTGVKKGPLAFSSDWFYGMWLRTFFTVGGPSTDYQSRGPFPVPGISAIVLAVAAAIASVVTLRRLMRTYQAPVLWLFAAVTAGYAFVLWLDDYRAFRQTGQPVAINGRYLLPVLPLIVLVSALALAELLQRRLAAKLAIAGVALLCLAWGGGALTFILRSNDIWYWPNQTVLSANHLVQRTVGPLTPGYGNPAEFLR